MYAVSSAPGAARSPHAPALLRKKVLEHVVQEVPDVQASQLAGQSTQMLAPRIVLAGQVSTVQAQKESGKPPYVRAFN